MIYYFTRGWHTTSTTNGNELIETLQECMEEDYKENFVVEKSSILANDLYSKGRGWVWYQQKGNNFKFLFNKNGEPINEQNISFALLVAYDEEKQERDCALLSTPYGEFVKDYKEG